MIPALVNNPLFRGITLERLFADLEEISFHTRSYKKGEILAQQGAVCNRLVILTKGSVRGEMIDYSGRLIKVEDIAAPRAIAPLFLFGEENRYPVEVTANEPTEVIELPKSSVLSLFRKNEQFLENYMNLSANYARTLSDKLFFMSFKTIRQKLASYLLRLYKQQQQTHITLDRSQQELSTMLNSTTDLMTTLLACIAGISLVVGGIGIMNIMYVSVTERTREIGLRMSVGARGVDILSQFLIEAIMISITGGIIGVIIGCGASWIVKSVAHWPIYIQPWSVFLSFAVCTVTGVFFGWYPAKKAADLDPIEAIRYE